MPWQRGHPLGARTGVEQVVICSPDKDLAQSVSGVSAHQSGSPPHIFLDEESVIKKFGIRPHSIPDWLPLVGDTADGYPGIPTWGAKSASAVLSQFDHLESIPEDPRQLGLPLGRAARLVESLRAHRQVPFSSDAWQLSEKMFR